MDWEGLLADAGEFTGGLQQTLESLFEVVEAAHLHGTTMAQEQIDERGEVFLMRSLRSFCRRSCLETRARSNLTSSGSSEL